MITITLNGKPYELSTNMSLSSCLKELKLSIPSRFVAIAHNGNVVSSTEWDTVEVHENDRLDIVRPIGGG